MINESQARKYCKEDISKIKNYDLAIADITQTWHCHHTDETRKKISEVHKGKPGFWKGMHLSEETKKKKSEAMKGKKRKPASDERRKKISEALNNRTFTEEHRRKLREASRRKWTLHKKKINGGTVNGCYF